MSFPISMNIAAPWLKGIVEDEGLLLYLHVRADGLATGLRRRLVSRANARFTYGIDDVHRKGAFNEDITVKRLPMSRSKNNLVKAYTAHDWQEALWGRVYDVYVEGPPLGRDTYTNPPRNIFADIEVLDGPYIQAWILSNAFVYYNAVGAL